MSVSFFYLYCRSPSFKSSFDLGLKNLLIYCPWFVQTFVGNLPASHTVTFTELINTLFSILLAFYSDNELLHCISFMHLLDILTVVTLTIQQILKMKLCNECKLMTKYQIKLKSVISHAEDSISL